MKKIIEQMEQMNKEYQEYLRKYMNMGGDDAVVFDDVVDERIRQNNKFGGPSNDDIRNPIDWYRDIRAYNEWSIQMARMDSPDKYRRRMIQIAALAIAAVQSHDRKMKK